MRVYLDNCCFNRPFDDQDSLTVRLETEAKLQVQRMVKDGTLALCWSYILDFENAANPFDERRTEIGRWNVLAAESTGETPEILDTARRAVSKGLKPIDALHLACAQALHCDVFLTVDKGILKRARDVAEIRVMSPIDFVVEKEGA